MISTLALLLNFLFYPLPADGIVDGYTNVMSAFPGESIEMYLNSTEYFSNRPIHLYSLEGTIVASYKISVFPQFAQADKAHENGFGYQVTGKIVVPQVERKCFLE
jgi:hypothetical protein